jgi:hypothetical protein
MPAVPPVMAPGEAICNKLQMRGEQSGEWRFSDTQARFPRRFCRLALLLMAFSATAALNSCNSNTCTMSALVHFSKGAVCARWPP